MSIHQREILILGVGNTILSDDGVGIYVAREIAKRFHDPDILVEESSVGGLELLDMMQGFNKTVIIDAVITGKREIGTLVRMSPEDLKGGSAMVRHHIGLFEALELGIKLNMDLPEKISVYGIEVKDTMTFGESCTPEVAACIQEIAKEIVRNEFSIELSEEERPGIS